MARRKQTSTGAVRIVRRHPYQGDGQPDHRGRDRCGDCGLGVEHAVHRLEPVDPDVVEASHRITGERDSE